MAELQLEAPLRAPWAHRLVRRVGTLGPPVVDAGQRRKAIATTGFFVALGLAIWLWGLSLTPDRFLLVVLVPALVLRRARVYLRDFVPFAILILIYQEARGVAHLISPHPFYSPQIDAERFLFGGIPTVDLQHMLWRGTLHWWDRACIALTRIHFFAPPALAFALWLRRRALFYRFATATLVLSFAGAIAFAIYPAAPPWAASDRALVPTLTLITSVHDSAYTLPTHSGFFYRGLLPNPYAAIPSLHGGYSFMVFLFCWIGFRGTRWFPLAVAIGALYAAAQAFAVVYTANHYVVDIFIGWAFTLAALWAVSRAWARLGLPE